MDIGHQVSSQDGVWILAVAPEDEAKAHHQLAMYWRENSTPEPAPVQAVTIDSGWGGVLGYLTVIWSLPVLQGFTSTSLSTAGVLHAEAISAGELFRAATALTLHADINHILANSLFGALFGLFVGRYLGSGFGWLVVLICGIAANLLNGFLQPDAFRALGASTATFAALGLVPAFGWRRGYFRRGDFKRGFAPIFGAIAILAFTGFGGQRIDVFGHLFGFIAGIIAGLAVAHVKVQTRTLADQWRAGGLALGLIGIAWGFALS